MPNNNVLTAGVRAAAIEECAKLVDALAEKWNQAAQSARDGRYDFMTEAADRCADEIRALAAQPGQPEPHASAGVIAAALAVIECDRAQVLTNEHIDALDNAIKIQRGELKLPEPRSSITDDQRDKIERAEACLRNSGRKEDREAANGLLDVLTEHPVLPKQRADASPDDHRDGTRWRALMKNGEPEVFVERTQRRAIQRTQPVAFSSPNLTGADRFDIPSEMWVKRYVMFAWWARENEHRKFVEAVDAISTGDIQ
ncbi:hypothetical protein [Burkholderia sp. BCC0097]|uniref:hypothetical protein n=1 Tax=Burkholderia sp. BCC0097 TaxID=2676289 RepID=UPI0015887068|nr:hypothetical protein [Burkholderia sp. BCC0097]